MASFDVKSQKILGSNEPSAGKWSIPFEYEPEDSDELSKRGKLYIVVDFVAKSDVDLHLASKIIIDAIKEHFYSDLDGTPLQALESAVAYGKDKLLQTAATNSSVELSFDLVACVVWGNILYLAQVGTTTSLIIRGGEVSDVSHKTSGEIMTTSGILENEDVVVLSTKSFENEFPTSDLVSKLANLEDLISSSPNSSSLSTVIISFRKNIVPNAKELASFVVPFRQKNKPKSKPVETSSSTESSSNSILVDDKLGNSNPVTSIGGQPSKNIGNEIPRTQSVGVNPNKKDDFELKPPSKRGRKAKQIFKSSGILLLLILVGVGVFALYKNFTGRDNPSDISVVVNDDLQGKFELLNRNGAVIEDYQKLREEVKAQVESGGLEYYDLLTSLDNKIEELGGSTSTSSTSSVDSYYNFIAKSDDSSVNNVVSFGNSLLVSDFGTKTAYLLTEGEDISIEDIVGGEDYLYSTTDGTNIYLIGKDTIFVGTTPENLQQFNLDNSLENVNAAYVYFGNVYLLSGNNILKLEKSGEEYLVTTWAEMDQSGNNLAVDGSIYVSNTSGVSKYYTGEKQEFSLSGVDITYKNPLLYLGSGTNLYVLSESTLYTFNKDSGNFIEQLDIEGLPNNPNSLLVTSTDLYVSEGSSIYKIPLTQEDTDSNEDPVGSVDEADSVEEETSDENQ